MTILCIPVCFYIITVIVTIIVTIIILDFIIIFIIIILADDLHDLRHTHSPTPFVLVLELAMVVAVNKWNFLIFNDRKSSGAQHTAHT